MDLLCSVFAVSHAAVRPAGLLGRQQVDDWKSGHGLVIEHSSACMFILCKIWDLGLPCVGLSLVSCMSQGRTSICSKHPEQNWLSLSSEINTLGRWVRACVYTTTINDLVCLGCQFSHGAPALNGLLGWLVAFVPL